MVCNPRIPHQRAPLSQPVCVEMRSEDHGGSDGVGGEEVLTSRDGEDGGVRVCFPTDR